MGEGGGRGVEKLGREGREDGREGQSHGLTLKAILL